jgi:hypothetical protein
VQLRQAKSLVFNTNAIRRASRTANCGAGTDAGATFKSGIIRWINGERESEDSAWTPPRKGGDFFGFAERLAHHARYIFITGRAVFIVTHFIKKAA